MLPSPFVTTVVQWSVPRIHQEKHILCTVLESLYEQDSSYSILHHGILYLSCMLTESKETHVFFDAAIA